MDPHKLPCRSGYVLMIPSSFEGKGSFIHTHVYEIIIYEQDSLMAGVTERRGNEITIDMLRELHDYFVQQRREELEKAGET